MCISTRFLPGDGSSGRRLPENCTLTMISGGRFQPEPLHKKRKLSVEGGIHELTREK